MTGLKQRIIQIIVANSNLSNKEYNVIADSITEKVQTIKLTGHTEEDIIDQAVSFWSTKTGTGGSFIIGLEKNDSGCLALLSDLMTNHIASVVHCYDGAKCIGVAYGGEKHLNMQSGGRLMHQNKTTNKTYKGGFLEGEQSMLNRSLLTIGTVILVDLENPQDIRTKLANKC